MPEIDFMVNQHFLKCVAEKLRVDVCVHVRLHVPVCLHIKSKAMIKYP